MTQVIKATEVHPLCTIAGLQHQLTLTTNEVNRLMLLPGGCWNNTTRIIFSGTFPPGREHINRLGYLPFSSPRNQFYKRIDAVYGTSLYISSAISCNERLRIKNANEKLAFFMNRGWGLIDVFTDIGRKKADSAKDTDIIEVETIFSNGVFENMLDSEVEEIVCVYSTAVEIYKQKIWEDYRVQPKVLIPYKSIDRLPLEVMEYRVRGRKLLLTYVPIHGPIEWRLKEEAFRRAAELDF